ncbi:D5 family helicase-primase [Tetraselmis virus 1]|uniref:D5 family helicase-primase n=1 Tax=Tetraselmis virus 1 TaxID=2060617 RepID=A0A2P0VNI6_9VIRU|nr:D5 family helicase-primase [Tetraselmis virus 1]AUF82467.1 D5 family helicase-primase [Tetraselmis virus 1]
MTYGASEGIEDFLRRFKTTGGRCPTHGRFGDNFGAYYIPVSENDRFFRLYSRYVTKTVSEPSLKHICLVERHRDVGPIVIDLDFRYDPTNADLGKIDKNKYPAQHLLQSSSSYQPSSADLPPPKRRFTAREIHRFIDMYIEVASQWINFPEDSEVYILQKPHPKLDIDKNVVKDGVHIMFPNIVTDVRVQILIRRDIIDYMKQNPLFDNCKNPIDDIVDESVIRRNGWMMYGSGKLGDATYNVVEHGKMVTRGDDMYFKYSVCNPPDTEEQILEYIKLFSVRNKNKNVHILPEKYPDIEAFIETDNKINSLKKSSRYLQSTPGKQYTSSKDDVDLANVMLNILDKERANCYNSWIKLGWCLHNIDNSLLSSWITFSKESPKFTAGVCEDLWDHMAIKPEGLGIGSLRKWARDDNPEKYQELIKASISGRVRAAITGLHHDVAMVVKALYGDQYICSSIKNNQWYKYQHHKWIRCDSGHSLRALLSIDIYNRFTEEARVCNNRAQGISAETQANDAAASAEHSIMAAMYKQLNDVANKLKTCAFKDAVMKELRELLIVDDFVSKLDTKPHLIGFENGVYDLDEHEFRNGSPEDMISFSTGYDYVPYDINSPAILDINVFFEQIQTNESVREYLLRLLGSYLNGNIREERFHVFTGVGRNGKSILIDLFERALGEYSCKLPVSLLTQKRAASNAASSEIARLKGRRHACLQEPSTDETLNTGLMKEMTGGDRLMARALYQEPFEFRSFARLTLVCNHLPNIPSTDGGTWRRIRLVEFDSKFVEEPNPDDPKEFLVDKGLSEKLDDWAPHLMALLIEYYKIYTLQGNTEPESVLKATKQYQQSQDSVKMFFDYNLEYEQDSEISVNDVHSMYKDYLHTMSIKVNPKRSDFMREMRNTLNSSVKIEGIGVEERFIGLAFKKKEEPAECGIIEA